MLNLMSHGCMRKDQEEPFDFSTLQDLGIAAKLGRLEPFLSFSTDALVSSYQKSAAHMLLCVAATNGNTQVVSHLLNSGVGPKSRDCSPFVHEGGLSPLARALIFDQDACALVLARAGAWLDDYDILLGSCPLLVLVSRFPTDDCYRYADYLFGNVDSALKSLSISGRDDTVRMAAIAVLQRKTVANHHARRFNGSKTHHPLPKTI